MEDIVNYVWQIIQMIIPFVLGLLFRKKVGRILVKIKKWILNDIITMDLLVVREYPNIKTKEIELSSFDIIKSKISSAQFVQSYSNGIIIKIPVFGNLILEIEKINNNETKECESVKLILKTEIPVRLTVRELKKIHQFEKYADNIFNSIEKTSLPSDANPIKSYAVCDLNRTTMFTENKILNKRDDDLNAIINVNNEILTISVSPMDTIGDATEKYHSI